MLKIDKIINLTDEDAENLVGLIEYMGKTAEVEFTQDKTKKYSIKFEEIK